MRKLAGLLAFFLILNTGYPVSGQDNNDIARLKQQISVFGQAEVTVKYPGYSGASILSRMFSVDHNKEGKLYIILSATTIDQFLALGLEFSLVPSPVMEGVKGAADLTKAMDWQSYPKYSQYDSIMRKLATDFPDLCQLDTIGSSINGKQVLVVKISDNVALNEPDEPEVFYSSTIHGDELLGFVLMLRLSDHLLRNYHTDPQIKSLVDNLQIYINPLSNPDGTYRTGDEIINPIRFNANGRDLNRNFPDPLQPGVVQEKENVDMIAFMRSRKFVLSANFHSGAEVVNYPWDRWLTKIHADDSWFEDLCRAYADTVHIYSRDNYMDGFDNGIVRGAVWYEILGGRQDFVTWELQGREVTIELDDTKLTPADSLENMWNYNYRSLLNYLSYAQYGINGNVTDSETGNPVRATIYIEGHDKDNSQINSDSGSGNYTRLLSGGTWDLTFSATGYRDTILAGQVLVSGEPLLLDVEMTPLPPRSHQTELLIFPNPSSGQMELLLPEWFEGEVFIEVFSSTGMKMMSKTMSYTPWLKLPIDLSHLAAGVYIISAQTASGGLSVSSRALIIR